jgi:hypothetical protein
MQMKYEEQIEKFRKENETCSLLVENYKKIRDQNCDLILELFGGTTLEVHKAILMGKLFLIHPSINH